MKKSRTTAAILAILGGWAGVDRFYLGQNIVGIVLLFMTFTGIASVGIPFAAIIGFLHAIVLLMSSDEAFDRRYNQDYRRRIKQKNQSRAQRENKRASRELREMDLQRERYAYKSKAKSRNNPFISSGRKKYKEYDLEGALADFTQALELSPNNAELHFDMAAVYSLKENTQKSLYHIDKAIALGVKKDEFLSHDDFAFVRIQPKFEEFQNNGFRLKGVAKHIEAPKEREGDVLLTQLNKLKDLRDRGLLSEKEFLYEKEKLRQR